MGIGSARGDDRAVAAAEMAISSPLLEASIDGAHGVLLSISGGSDLGLFEINEAAPLVAEAAHPEANIIFGAVIDDALGDEVRVTVIAAGFDGGAPEHEPARAAAAGASSAGAERPAATPARGRAPAAAVGAHPDASACPAALTAAHGERPASRTCAAAGRIASDEPATTSTSRTSSSGSRADARCSRRDSPRRR